MNKDTLEKLKKHLIPSDVDVIQVSVLKPSGAQFSKAYIRLVLSGERENVAILQKAIDILEERKKEKQRIENRIEKLIS